MFSDTSNSSSKMPEKLRFSISDFQRGFLKLPNLDNKSMAEINILEVIKTAMTLIEQIRPRYESKHYIYLINSHDLRKK